MPVRGGATISARCPLPIGVSRSITRIVIGVGPVSSLIMLERVDRRELIEVLDLGEVLRVTAVDVSMTSSSRGPCPRAPGPTSPLILTPSRSWCFSISELETNGSVSTRAVVVRSRPQEAVFLGMQFEHALEGAAHDGRLVRLSDRRFLMPGAAPLLAIVAILIPSAASTASTSAATLLIVAAAGLRLLGVAAARRTAGAALFVLTAALAATATPTTTAAALTLIVSVRGCPFARACGLAVRIRRSGFAIVSNGLGGGCLLGTFARAVVIHETLARAIVSVLAIVRACLRRFRARFARNDIGSEVIFGAGHTTRPPSAGRSDRGRYIRRLIIAEVDRREFRFAIELFDRGGLRRARLAGGATSGTGTLRSHTAVSENSERSIAHTAGAGGVGGGTRSIRADAPKCDCSQTCDQPPRGRRVTQPAPERPVTQPASQAGCTV